MGGKRWGIGWCFNKLNQDSITCEKQYLEVQRDNDDIFEICHTTIAASKPIVTRPQNPDKAGITPKKNNISSKIQTELKLTCVKIDNVQTIHDTTLDNVLEKNKIDNVQTIRDITLDNVLENPEVKNIKIHNIKSTLKLPTNIQKKLRRTKRT